MNKAKLIKTATTLAVAVLPFGLVAVGGYYGYKHWKKKKTEKDKENGQGH